jgi:uncharacterized membrane protein YqjE
MIITLTILNLLDYTLTLLNRGNFEEANPLTRNIIDNTLALTILKLIIVPLCVYVLWRYKDKPIVKIASVVLCLVYIYAVTLGVLIYASN